MRELPQANSQTEIGRVVNTIICGDALNVLKTFPSESVDMIFTSPPYW